VHRILPNEVADDIRSQIPKDTLELINFITSLDFHLTLVGGAVRDFLLTEKLSTDLDFEIRHDQHFVNDEWLAKLVVLQFEIQKTFPSVKIETLSFGVFRVIFENGDDVEIAPARIEKFISGRIDHKNFEADFISDLDYKEAVKRRDITINTLGISFTKSGELILRDPTSFGEADIHEKRLRQVSDDFAKDPVRLLRAVRFAKKFNLSYSQDFLNILDQFNLEKISPHYFISEGLKADFYPWAYELKKVLADSKTPIVLPEFMEKFLSYISWPKGTVRPVHTQLDLVFQGLYAFDIPEEAMSFVPLKQKLVKSLSALTHCLRNSKCHEAQDIFLKLPSDIQESLSYVKTQIDLEDVL
jgi:tRNA nucleotidyltransferase (CCA-adding enzyme)